MNDEVAKTLTVALDSDQEIDPKSLGMVLRNYPAAFSFLVTQHRIIKATFVNMQQEYNEFYNQCWVHAVAESPTKATGKTIEAKAHDLHGDEISDMKKNLNDLEQKVKMTSDMVTVFTDSIKALQSLNSLMTSERNFFSRRLT